MNVEDIKKLRDMTGAGMMAAKKALEEADGNMERAVEGLRRAGQATAAKKIDREARNGVVESYTHGGRIGVVVEVNCETDFSARTEDFQTFAHDVAMQIAAAAPEYVAPSDVPKERVESEKAFYRSELEGQNKPAEMVEKIVEGKLEKFYSQICLIRQPFVKDPDRTIEQLVQELVTKIGENIVIRRFARLELGENS